MAHYAIIDASTNMVSKIITGVDETVTQIDTDGTEVGGSSEAWEQFYGAQLNNSNYYVKRTSYNGNIRGRHAGAGMKYDPELDEFVEP